MALFSERITVQPTRILFVAVFKEYSRSTVYLYNIVMGYYTLHFRVFVGCLSSYS